MRLRPVLASLLLLSLGATTAASATPVVHGKQVGIPAADVQQYLDGSFPRSKGALGGLLQLTVSHPQLSLPKGERLNLVFDLAMAAAGGAQSDLGSASLSSALRYDVASNGFFLDQPSIDSFHPAKEGARLDSRTQGLLNAWLTDYARKQPIYKLDPAIANLMGALQVESAGIEDGRLVVHFNHNIEGLIPAGLLHGR